MRDNQRLARADVAVVGQGNQPAPRRGAGTPSPDGEQAKLLPASAVSPLPTTSGPIELAGAPARQRRSPAPPATREPSAAPLSPRSPEPSPQSAMPLLDEAPSDSAQVEDLFLEAGATASLLSPPDSVTLPDDEAPDGSQIEGALLSAAALTPEPAPEPDAAFRRRGDLPSPPDLLPPGTPMEAPGPVELPSPIEAPRRADALQQPVALERRSSSDAPDDWTDGPVTRPERAPTSGYPPARPSTPDVVRWTQAPRDPTGDGGGRGALWAPTDVSPEVAAPALDRPGAAPILTPIKPEETRPSPPMPADPAMPAGPALRADPALAVDPAMPDDVALLNRGQFLEHADGADAPFVASGPVPINPVAPIISSGEAAPPGGSDASNPAPPSPVLPSSDERDDGSLLEHQSTNDAVDDRQDRSVPRRQLPAVPDMSQSDPREYWPDALESSRQSADAVPPEEPQLAVTTVEPPDAASVTESTAPLASTLDADSPAAAGLNASFAQGSSVLGDVPSPRSSAPAQAAADDLGTALTAEARPASVSSVGEEAGPDLGASVEPLLSAGGDDPPSVLSASSRAFLTPLVGIDPASVIIRQDAAAQAVTAAQGADALTQGEVIALGSGQAPDMPSTIGLLAHELTHVAQGRQPRFVPPVLQAPFRADTAGPIGQPAESTTILPTVPTAPIAPPVGGPTGDLEAVARAVESRVTTLASGRFAPAVAAWAGQSEAPAAPLSLSLPAPVSAAQLPADPWNGLPAPWEPWPAWAADPPSLTVAAAQPAHTVLSADPMGGAAGDSGATVGATSSVQRADTGRMLPQEEAPAVHPGSIQPDQDLDALARQVYAILGRRLAAERRRLG